MKLSNFVSSNIRYQHRLYVCLLFATEQRSALRGILFRRVPRRDSQSVSLSFAAVAPWHLLQRFEKVDELPIRKRTADPGVIGANKASAVRDQAVHRLSDGRMMVSAGINAIVFSKTGNVADIWCICGHDLATNYTPNQDAI